MANKTILITGATDGIGRQSALELARLGHHILVHGRNPARAQATVDELRRAVKNAQLDPVAADFASLQQVRELAQQVRETYPELDILINNAGVFKDKRTLTPDGYETTFQVNHLAHFLLTLELLDLFKANAPARIIHVSSGTHRSGHIEWDNLQGEKHYSGYDAYSRSKLANVLFSNQLAERLEGTHVTSNSLHPGVISTKLLHAGWGSGGDRNLPHGAETIVYTATAPGLDSVTGAFFDNRRQTKSSPASHDHQLQTKLWDVSAQLVGIEA